MFILFAGLDIFLPDLDFFQEFSVAFDALENVLQVLFSVFRNLSDLGTPAGDVMLITTDW